MKVYGVIMAGGGGTRFWPLSRRKTPKQLLNLTGKSEMVNEAIDRLKRVTDEIFIVTNQSQTDKMKRVTGDRIAANHILSEPSARNTAACIGYAATEILRKYGDGIMIITPSDAYIRNDIEFADVLLKAVRTAEKTGGLVTVGIQPTFPATGYGYIRFARGEETQKVLSFKEKPDAATARVYVDSGDYLWNSGMFIWKASVILEKFKELLPDIYADLKKIGDSFGTDREKETIAEVYPSIRSVSVDYGIMERAENIYVETGDFGWNDVGSWDMMGVLHAADEDGNVTVGDCELVDTKDCVAYSCQGKLVACVDVEGLVVVQTDDAVLVCPKEKVQDVKLIVERLKEKKKEQYL